MQTSDPRLPRLRLVPKFSRFTPKQQILCGSLRKMRKPVFGPS